MPPGQPSLGLPDNRVWIAGDLTPEELDELGPEPTVTPPLSWTREEYKAQMLRRGIVDACDQMGLGIDGYLELAEAAGILEKRPNTLWIVGACTLPSSDSAAVCCLQPEFRRRGPA